MGFDIRLSRPEDYMDDVSKFFRSPRRHKVDYKSAFANKASEGEAPFNTGRLGFEELTKKMTSRKLTENPRLEFIDEMGNNKVFAGIGRFNKETDYNFDLGKPNTILNFTQTPIYNPMWAETYKISPTVMTKVDSPMPSVFNPDPNGVLQASADTRLENELEGNLSVAQILREGKEG